MPQSVKGLTKLLRAIGVVPSGRSKYHARPTVVDGIRFDSLAEASRYRVLDSFVLVGMISRLIVHPVFPIEINGVVVCRYEADFAYIGKPAAAMPETPEENWLKRNEAFIKWLGRQFPGKKPFDPVGMAGAGWVIEDVKGVRTDVYRLKRRLFEAAYPLKITEVEAYGSR